MPAPEGQNGHMPKLSRTNYFKTLPTMRLFYGSEDTPNWRPLPIKEVANGGRMDDEEFRRKLSEVAEWRIPELSKTDIKEAKQRARGRKSAEDLYQEEHEQIFLEIFDGINPSAPIELVKVKHKPTTCNDCGKTCPNGCHKEKKFYVSGGKPNWRERCATCELHKNPFTGRFELTTTEASRVWTDFLRDRKGEYKSKFARAKEELAIKATDPTAIEDEQGIITINPDSRRSI